MSNLWDNLEQQIALDDTFSAFMRITDYPLLEIIRETFQKMCEADQGQDWKKLDYVMNQGFWKLGKAIAQKLSVYPVVPDRFFENMLANICDNFEMEVQSKPIFTIENLKRCLKWVELAEENWFKGIARKLTWMELAELIDRHNDAQLLKIHASEILTQKALKR